MVDKYLENTVALQKATRDLVERAVDEVRFMPVHGAIVVAIRLDQQPDGKLIPALRILSALPAPIVKLILADVARFVAEAPEFNAPAPETVPVANGGGNEEV